MPAVQSYLIFSGNCEEAVQFYCDIFKGDIKFLQKYKEAPVDTPQSWDNKIMHASFVIKDTLLMASDSGPDIPVIIGNNIHLSVSYDKDNNPDEHFNKLAIGGKITKPIEKTFWGARFGQLVDRYGVHWMFNQHFENEK
jgi:PhnB protein